ncbi:MAG: PfkB family carbohydrate kinase [Patescibacteria group bacterium]|nr:PfkB family carbohydrate kinase [Patescibacteria group bacterium]
MEIAKAIDNFRKLKVLVIGEAILDGYFDGRAIRLCREAPVPVVNVDKKNFVPGGAANTAVNLANLGAETTLISVTGNDQEEKILNDLLLSLGVSVNLLASEKRKTLNKARILADEVCVVRVDEGSIEDINFSLEEKLTAKIVEIFPSVDVVVISDYDYGILTKRVLGKLKNLQKRYPKLIVVDAKKLSKYKELEIEAVTPSYSELAKLLFFEETEQMVDRVAQVKKYGRQLFYHLKTKQALVTIDSDGVIALTQGEEPRRIEAERVDHPQVVGAGDTFTAALALSLGVGLDLASAAKLASTSASIVIKKQGTSFVTAEELLAKLGTKKEKLTVLKAIKKFELAKEVLYGRSRTQRLAGS